MLLAVITGGTRGIGKATVEIFSQNGFDIVTCARDKKQLLLLKQEIESTYSNQVFIQETDLGNKAQCHQLADYIESLNKSVDVLVNNAGVFLQDVFSSGDETHLETLLQCNVLSVYYLTTRLLPSMLQKRNGHIFNVGSIASLAAYPNSASYTVSKHALLGFSRVLRAELLEKQIRVTSVLPGATYTSSWEGVDLPENRFMKSSDIAKTIWSAFALSENANVEEITLRPTKGDI